MSILIKSNSLYAGSSILPTAKQQSTTPDAVYNEYVARVEADGGEVTDKAKLMDAIQFMFRQNLYGRMSTVVAPLYGKKLDSNGKLLKLYAIDGDDLESVSVGGAPLPHIDAHNQVVFNDTIEGANESAVGSYMTTADKKVRSLVGRIGVAFRSWSPYGIGSTSESHSAVGLTEHNLGSGDFRLPYLRAVVSSYTAGTIRVEAIKSGLTYTPITHTATNSMGSGYESSTITQFDYNRQTTSKASRYNPRYDSIVFNQYKNQTLDKSTFKNPTYIDFGGVFPNELTRGFARLSCPFLWLFSDITEAHVEAFQKWQVKHYPLPL